MFPSRTTPAFWGTLGHRFAPIHDWPVCHSCINRSGHLLHTLALLRRDYYNPMKLLWLAELGCMPFDRCHTVWPWCPSALSDSNQDSKGEKWAMGKWPMYWSWPGVLLETPPWMEAWLPVDVSICGGTQQVELLPRKNCLGRLASLTPSENGSGSMGKRLAQLGLMMPDFSVVAAVFFECFNSYKLLWFPDPDVPPPCVFSRK